MLKQIKRKKLIQALMTDYNQLTREEQIKTLKEIKEAVAHEMRFHIGKEEAISKAREFSLQTLGASTFLEKGGRKVQFSLGEGFRESKADRFIQVQEKGKRLGSFGERKEIKRTKKSRGLFG